MTVYSHLSRCGAMFAALSCLSLGHPALAASSLAPSEEQQDEPEGTDTAEPEAEDGVPGDEADGDVDADAEGSDDADASEEEVADQATDDEKAGAKPAPKPEPEPEPRRPKRERKPIDKKALGISIAGYVAVAAGIGFLGGMGGSIGTARKASDDAAAADLPSTEQDRIDAIDRGNRADTLALAFGVTGGVLLATGAILAGIGTPKLLRSRKQTASNFCLPSGGRNTVGLGCQVSF